MNEVISYFEKLGIEECELGPFLDSLTIKKFKKGDRILCADKTDDYLSFLANGLIRFFVPKDDKEFTFDFIFPNSFYCHYDSFYNRKPTHFFCEALVDSTVYRLHHDNLESMFETCKYAKDLSRIAVEKLLERKVRRELSLLVDTPEERYLKLLRKQTKLVQQVPLKYVASYLGIVPETLSRIRKRIS